VFRELAEHALKSIGVPPTEPTKAGAQVLAAVVRTEAGTPERPSDPGRSEPVTELPEAPDFEEAPARADDGGRVAVPVLAGLPARSALRALEEADLVGDVKGSGRVVSQVPRAGQVVERGVRVRLNLAPPRP
jgi:cell division protein FtsI (penicillin-binding protein 3)